MVIIDADVMIELLRKNISARSFIINEVGSSNAILSCITVAIDYKISDIFSTIFQKYILSHRMGIADALVASTALYYNLPLLSINQKHFKHIPDLKLLAHNIVPIKGKSLLL